MGLHFQAIIGVLLLFVALCQSMEFMTEEQMQHWMAHLSAERRKSVAYALHTFAMRGGVFTELMEHALTYIPMTPDPVWHASWDLSPESPPEWCSFDVSDEWVTFENKGDPSVDRPHSCIFMVASDLKHGPELSETMDAMNAFTVTFEWKDGAPETSADLFFVQWGIGFGWETRVMSPPNRVFVNKLIPIQCGAVSRLSVSFDLNEDTITTYTDSDSSVSKERIAIAQRFVKSMASTVINLKKPGTVRYRVSAEMKEQRIE